MTATTESRTAAAIPIHIVVVRSIRMVVVRTHKFRVPAFRHVYKIVCLARILEPHQGNTRCETEVITGRWEAQLRFASGQHTFKHGGRSDSYQGMPLGMPLGAFMKAPSGAE